MVATRAAPPPEKPPRHGRRLVLCVIDSDPRRCRSGVGDVGDAVTRAQNEAAVIRNLPATFATLAHLVSSEDAARKAVESLRVRGVLEEVGGVWRRRESVTSWRRSA